MRYEKAKVKLNDYELNRCIQAEEFLDILYKCINDAEDIFTSLDCDFYLPSVISSDSDNPGHIPTYTIKDLRDLIGKIREEKGFYIYKNVKEET